MKKLYCFMIKLFICLLIFLCLGIFGKSNVNYREFIRKKIYHERISFSAIEKIYNRYLGGIFPIEFNYTNDNVSEVFNEKLSYQKIDDYLDGARLIVGVDYLIPSQDDGIVVYIGEKDGYNNVIMIENKEGIDVWYGNICNGIVKLYDQIKKGNYLGTSCSNEMYLVYTKGNEILNYNDYLG